MACPIVRPLVEVFQRGVHCRSFLTLRFFRVCPQMFPQSEGIQEKKLIKLKSHRFAWNCFEQLGELFLCGLLVILVHQIQKLLLCQKQKNLLIFFRRHFDWRLPQLSSLSDKARIDPVLKQLLPIFSLDN